MVVLVVFFVSCIVVYIVVWLLYDCVGADVRTILFLFFVHDGTFMVLQMIGLFKIRMGQAKGLDADSRRTGARVTDLFMSLDRDQSRSIGKDELTKYMKTNRIDLNSSQIDAVIERFDEMGKLDEDGEIPYSDFVECLTGKLS